MIRAELIFRFFSMKFPAVPQLCALLPATWSYLPRGFLPSDLGELRSSPRQESHKVGIPAQCNGSFCRIFLKIGPAFRCFLVPSHGCFQYFCPCFIIVYLWRNFLKFSCHHYENLTQVSIIRLLKVFVNLICFAYCFFNIIVQITSMIEHFLSVYGYLYFSILKLPAHFLCLFLNSGILCFFLLNLIFSY